MMTEEQFYDFVNLLSQFGSTEVIRPYDSPTVMILMNIKASEWTDKKTFFFAFEESLQNVFKPLNMGQSIEEDI